MTARGYRLPPPDRTGWVLGLGGAQVLPLGAGIAVAVVLITLTGSAFLGMGPAVLGAVVAFTRVEGEPLLEVAPTAARFVAHRRQRRFDAPFPFPGTELILPKAFGRAEFIEASTADGKAVVAVDRSTGSASATLRVAARIAFLLGGDGEQAQLLDSFGDALTPLCREGGPVTSLRWTSFATAAGRPPSGATDGVAVPAYREVLDLLASDARHEVFATLTVRVPGRVRSRQRLVDVALEEAGLLAERLDAAGLHAELLDPAGFASALRRRLDPEGRGSAGHLASLARAAHLPVAAAGPLCVKEDWSQVRVDGTVHRCYHVVEWPRSEIPPGWTADLLLTLPLTRTVCVVFEPVSARVSRRAVERLAAKLDSDEEQRRRTGFRVGAEQEATRDGLAARERELVAGHCEFDCSGFVVLSAGSADEFGDLEARARSVGAAAGIELAVCHGRQAEALALTLPVPLASQRRPR